LASAHRAGETLGFLGGAEERLRLVDAFLLLELRVGIGDDAGAEPRSAATRKPPGS
jgi:hypothetical protein